MKLVYGTELSARKLAKMMGRVEQKAFPPGMALGWGNFCDDIEEYGADYCVLVTDDEGEEALAYAAIFDPGEDYPEEYPQTEGHLYVSDLSRDPDLSEEDRYVALVLLAQGIGQVVGDRPIFAELRYTSRGLLNTFCTILEENLVEDNWANGEDALQVRAVIDPVKLARAAELLRRAGSRRRNAGGAVWRTLVDWDGIL